MLLNGRCATRPLAIAGVIPGSDARSASLAVLASRRPGLPTWAVAGAATRANATRANATAAAVRARTARGNIFTSYSFCVSDPNQRDRRPRYRTFEYT